MQDRALRNLSLLLCLVLLGLDAALPCQARPIHPSLTAPNTLRARVSLAGEEVAVTNLNRFPWKRARFFLDSTGSPENFRSVLMTVAPGQTLRLSVRSFHRPAAIGTPDFNPDVGNVVIDFLVVCDTPRGPHKGYWYGSPLY